MESASASASTSASTASSIISPEDVLESLMNDGTIDALRLKIINQLKANEELKNTAIRMAEQSKVLNTPGAEKQTKRELFDGLRQELEAPVLEMASKSVWEVILDSNGLGREISETVERVYYRLSGKEPPLFPRPDTEALSNKENDNKGGEEKEAESEIRKGKSKSSSKKRNYSEINTEGGGGGVANQAGHEVAGNSGDSAVQLHSSNKSSLPP